MSYCSEDSSRSSCPADKKLKGVRRRKWGKWVSEIRVPGTQQRLWLGSYSTPEAAAVAHDVAYYCLHRPTTLDNLNFPAILPRNIDACVSHNSIQRAASDAGMAIDAQIITEKATENNDAKESENGSGVEVQSWGAECVTRDHSANWATCGEADLSISIEDYLSMK